jgi:hypothetical protein
MSPTSTPSGCSIAKAMARATASGGIAIWPILAWIWAFISGSVMGFERIAKEAGVGTGTLYRKLPDPRSPDRGGLPQRAGPAVRRRPRTPGDDAAA